MNGWIDKLVLSSFVIVFLWEGMGKLCIFNQSLYYPSKHYHKVLPQNLLSVLIFSFLTDAFRPMQWIGFVCLFVCLFSCVFLFFIPMWSGIKWSYDGVDMFDCRTRGWWVVSGHCAMSKMAASKWRLVKKESMQWLMGYYNFRCELSWPVSSLPFSVNLLSKASSSSPPPHSPLLPSFLLITLLHYYM